ncbi:unnamed protein product [Mytilus coruscus]|uniref:Uncharacterized protein n=1 Tax=Mytilus coruscus TaxID=42192 RepID=A0A6J7ZZH0_MYTCO|nr:unnamed protein product [Mytilus coruscus]
MLDTNIESENVLFWSKATGTFLISSAVLYIAWTKIISKAPKKDHPPDTVILHQIGRGPYAPSMTPYAIKLETYLRMANIPYEVDCVNKRRILKDGTDFKSTKECIDCSCTEGFLSCCSIGIRIRRKPANCKVVPDGPCSQKAVLIADKTKPCPGRVSGLDVKF